MPLHTNKQLNNDTRVVLWEITESVDWFLNRLHLDEEEQVKYKDFRTDLRRVHWLAYRHILKNVLGWGHEIRIRYDEHSKPFIELSDHHISVSHAGKFAAVIMGNNAVGIDVEQVTQRLHRVADKFLTSEEVGMEPSELSTEALCLHWCAKEALYKLYGERLLDFRRHIQVLDIPENLEGEFTALINNGKKNGVFNLVSEKVEDYFLVFAFDHAQ